jgi:hypothetical protein
MKPGLKYRMHAEQDQGCGQDEEVAFGSKSLLIAGGCLRTLREGLEFDVGFDLLDFSEHTLRVSGLQIKTQVGEIHRSVSHSRQLPDSLFDFKAAGRAIQPSDRI